MSYRQFSKAWGCCGTLARATLRSATVLLDSKVTVPVGSLFGHRGKTPPGILSKKNGTKSLRNSCNISATAWYLGWSCGTILKSQTTSYTVARKWLKSLSKYWDALMGYTNGIPLHDIPSLSHVESPLFVVHLTIHNQKAPSPWVTSD